MGQAANGIRYCEEALALDPLLEETRRALIRAYVDLGDVQAAGQLVEDDEIRTRRSRALPMLLHERRWAGTGGRGRLRVARTRDRLPKRRWA